MIREMERQNFDTELFIDEIEKRPAIWDLESPDYANRILKRRSWEELVLIFSDKDDSEEKKKDLGNTLQKKWKGLRDTFVREMKKTKNAPSGSGASKIQYIYFQRLMFLERSVRNKKTESNIQDTSENSETGNEESTVDAADEDIMRAPNQNIKRKKMTAADAEFLNIIKKNISSRNQQQPPVSSVTEGDDDKLFCLSLHKELLKVPEANRIAVKIELMKILQAAQQSSQSTVYSNNSYSSNSSASFSTSIPVRYHAQPSRPNEFSYQEYDPETPSITAWQERNYISVPRSSQASLYVNSPSTSSRDSQDSECLELFQNHGVD
ncbi:hypothetical protein HW555_013220 [Spodoptera exigua]|uniref:MADF domain-containing protein n=1 Tax=Spodoptera exigua TaxID=7107 RepID=A0A835G5Q6_SPOEX|nr:hypothetical protein HW555_013220 [Spodoptera exigua]